MANRGTPVILTRKSTGERLDIYAEYTKNVKETMPAASAEFVGVSILYLGATTADFTTAHAYTCVNQAGGYAWADVTPAPSSNPTTMVGKVTFVTTESTGSRVVLSRETLGILEDEPEYDILDANGYNITADARITRRWTASGYEVTFLGGWPAGTYTAKTCFGDTYSRAEIDRRFAVILEKLQTI